MAGALTTRTIESMKPGAARQEIPDAHMPGLYLIVQPTGAKSWAVRYRFAGKPRKATLGPYPRLDLKVARELGAKALRFAAEGRDIAEEKRQKAQAPDDSVEAIVERFIERHLKRNYRPKPLKEAERLLRVHVVAAWRRRAIGSITRKDVRDMLDKIVAGGAPIVANRVHTPPRNATRPRSLDGVLSRLPPGRVRRSPPDRSGRQRGPNRRRRNPDRCRPRRLPGLVDGSRTPPPAAVDPRHHRRPHGGRHPGRCAN